MIGDYFEFRNRDKPAQESIPQNLAETAVDADQILELFFACCEIEVTFCHTKQHQGLGEAQNRAAKAVRRIRADKSAAVLAVGVVARTPAALRYTPPSFMNGQEPGVMRRYAGRVAASQFDRSP